MIVDVVDPIDLVEPEELAGLVEKLSPDRVSE
jgi:hypothetical protein